MTAPMTAITRMAYLRYWERDAEVTMPNLAKKKIKSGVSKLKPTQKRREVMKEMYLSTNQLGLMRSLRKPFRNGIAVGSITK